MNFAISTQPLIVLLPIQVMFQALQQRQLQPTVASYGALAASFEKAARSMQALQLLERPERVGGNNFFGCLGSKVSTEVMQNGNLVLFLQLFSC